VEEIERVLGQTKYAYELIFIDDCSKDGTARVIKQICATRPEARYILHSKNLGRGGTVKEGLLLAKAPYAGFLDIDLEVHARYIPSALLLLEDGYDLVTVDRVERFVFGFNEIIRLIFSKTYNKLAHFLLPVRHPDTEAGFKFFNLATMREVIERTKNPGWFWDTEVVVRAEAAGKKLGFIQGVFGHRRDKKSTVRLIPDSLAYLKAVRDFKKNND
jgi:glycosyltransferase involved in cell wall biosynthesis